MLKKLTALFFLMIFLSTSALLAQDELVEKIKKNLPKMQGINNQGNDFWFTIPPPYDNAGGTGNFIKIFVISPVRTKVTVEIPGRGYNYPYQAKANEVLEINVPSTVGPPFRKNINDPNVPEAVYVGYGIHVYSDDPIVVYVVARYQATSDGFMAIPSSALGREYITCSYADLGVDWPGLHAPSMCGIVGVHNGTKVKFIMGGDAISMTAGGLHPGESSDKTLDKGDVWMFSSLGAGHDLSGSKIIADKPVAVVSGNFCADIPINNKWCDYVCEMDIPSYTWGTELHVPQVPGRVFPELIRVFAKEANTKIYRDGQQIATVYEAGGVNGVGYYETRLVPLEQKPRSALISGNKPITVTVLNPGVQEDQREGKYPNSDPFIMAITPMEQYQTEIMFCTPGVNGGKRFAENYVALVYQLNENGNMGDDLEFAVVENGQYTWTKVKVKYPGKDEFFVATKQGKNYACRILEIAEDAVYKIRDSRPFAAYSFGYDSYDSYGYPTSSALLDMERPDTVNPDPKWTIDCGDVDGTVTDYPNEDSIRTNLNTIQLDPVNSYNYVLEYDDFIPGETRTTNWRLRVEDKTQDAYAIVYFNDRRGNDTSIEISYYATKFKMTPILYNYGLLKQGADATYTFAIVNESDKAPATITELKLKSGGEGFEIIGATIPHTIAPLDTFKFDVKFTASEPGVFEDSIGVGDICSFSYRTEIQAAVGEPVIEVSDIDFGDVTINSTEERSFTIKNTGDANLIITGFTGPIQNVYKSQGSQGLQAFNISTTNPLIIQPDDDPVNVMVQFTPTTEGVVGDSIVFISDASTIDNVCLLTGRGVTQGLVANSYDWGKRRIDRPGFSNDGPYPADNAYQVIVLRNTSTTLPVRITNFNVNVVSGSVGSFEYTTPTLPFDIQPDAFEYVPVNFHPTTTGDHEIIITYTNDAGSTTQSRLQGIGIVPRVSTFAMNFDTTVVESSGGTPNSRVITISNPDLTTWQYGDTLTINDLIMNPANSVSENLSAWGDAGFHYDKAFLGLPIILEPGKDTSFTVEFLAQNIGWANASLTTQSDAEAEATTDWIGFGIRPGATAIGDGTTICVGEYDTLVVQMINTGSKDVNVTGLSLDPLNPEFMFLDFDDEDGFTLAIGQQRDIEVLFSPSLPGTKVVDVIAANLEGLDIRATLQCNAESFERSISAKPKTGQVVDNDGKQIVVIGAPARITVSLDAGDDIALANLTSCQVVVTYLKDILNIKDNNAITIGNEYKDNFDISNLQINQTLVGDPTKNYVIFNLNSRNNSIFNQEGDLAHIEFQTYLPQGFNRDATFDVAVYPLGTACVAIQPKSTDMYLAPVCADSIRKITISSTQFSLNAINPNPVGETGGQIKYSVGFECPTEIVIYNSVGETVAVLVNSSLKSGEYEIDIPVNILSSGTYIVHMKSGPYSESRPLIIAK